LGFELLNERAHLSPEMALGVEKAFDVSMTRHQGDAIQRQAAR
jgi:plasmid maintenance system antidote protein VapI